LEQVKEHHRLLMRVFHPDRENRADDWKDAFATRINLAYTTLRDADERRRYDASLQQARPPGVTLPARRAAGHHHPAARRAPG
jgi:DnaJ-class molecular chaperone